MAHVYILHNPFMPERDRDLFEVPHPITIRQWLTAQGITTFKRPTLCLLNEQPVLRAEWDTVIQGADIVTFVTLPQGGRGGAGKILRSVLTIAVMVAAPFAGAALAGAVGVASTVGTALISAGIAFAGSALLNVLIPPPTPSANASSGFGETSTPSPTYSLQAQGNQARLGQPIPVIYGQHNVYPDLAATPYASYHGNDQYLYQLLCIGQGEYEIEHIRIEDTPMSSFAEITHEVIPPGGTVTLFDVDVVTAPEVAGQELTTQWVGPFIVNPAHTECHKIQIDTVMPRGIYYANNNGGFERRTITWRVEARSIDNTGVATGNWKTLQNKTFTAGTNTPQRLTSTYTVAPGRYEVRARRTDTKDTSARAGHDLHWSGLKAILDRPSDFSGVTLLALKMRATDNLSQRSSRLVNCIVTRKLPTWSPETGWSKPIATRSIAWALADMARNGYGGKLDDQRIDLEALSTLNATWEERSDHFDAVFDQTVTLWEALSRTARCGRAVTFMQSGTVRCVRDEPRHIPVALFSPRNIVKNSLKIQYVLSSEDTADSVTVEYFSCRTWRPDEETVSLPESHSERPARVRLFGCTEREQAIREGLYMAAANRYRRRLITFQTELDGLIPTYGDLIAVTHDMPSWGQGAEVVTHEGPVLTLSEALEWRGDDDHFISLRRSDGGVSGPWKVTPGNTAYQVILSDDIDITPYTGERRERTHVAFGVGDAWAIRARVTAVRPRGERIEISAVAENPLMHDLLQ